MTDIHTADDSASFLSAWESANQALLTRFDGWLQAQLKRCDTLTAEVLWQDIRDRLADFKGNPYCLKNQPHIDATFEFKAWLSEQATTAPNPAKTVYRMVLAEFDRRLAESNREMMGALPDIPLTRFCELLADPDEDDGAAGLIGLLENGLALAHRDGTPADTTSLLSEVRTACGTWQSLLWSEDMQSVQQAADSWLGHLPKDCLKLRVSLSAYADTSRAMGRQSVDWPDFQGRIVTVALGDDNSGEPPSLDPTHAAAGGKSGDESTFESTDPPELSRTITPIKPPTRQDDFFCLIRDTAREFEAEHGHTPTEAELWGRLTTKPSPTYGAKNIQKPNRPVAVVLGGKAMGRKSFNGRYKRYF